MMMWLNAPWPPERSEGLEAAGMCGIPENIDFDFHEGPDEDEFVRLLIEAMSKPISRRPMSLERTEQIRKGEVQ